MRAPMAARRFQPGQFYRLQNFETLAPSPTARAWRWKASRSPAPGSTASAGLVSTIVLEMGGSSDLCALLQARRAGGADGPDRHADRDPRRRDRAAGRRRARQRGAVLHRPGAARRRIARCSTSPATRGSIDRYKVARDRGAPPTSSSGAATRRRASRRRGRRTAPSSATSSRRWRPTRRERWAAARCRSPDADRIIAIGSDGMMAAVAPSAPRRPRAAT